MRQVVVLGGYGHLGRLCVRELVEHTDVRITVAGRSVQRADALALVYGERVRGVYCNALDARTVARTIEGSDAVLACCGGDLLALIDAALDARSAFVGMTPLALDARIWELIGERAWKAQVPVILQAGALPGLPGIVAELLVRGVSEIRELRIVSTGPWLESQTAAHDQGSFAARRSEPLGRAGRLFPLRWAFPEVGSRSVRASTSADLEGFSQSHLVEQLNYLEPANGVVARGLARLVRDASEPAFALAARATIAGDQRGAAAGIDLYAESPLLPAAALAGALIGAALEGSIAAGVQTPREALNPARAIRQLEKRGVRVSMSGLE